MKRIIFSILITGIMLTTVFSVCFSATAVYLDQNKKTDDNQISMSYSFKGPTVEKVEEDGTVYDRLIMEDSPCGGNPGEPSLPKKGAKILLPQCTKVSEIKGSHDKPVSLGLGFMVEPVAEPVPLSMINSATPPQPDSAIYSSTEMFPGELFTEVGTYNFRGYKILVLTLHPVQYIPFSGELLYYPNLMVTVETVEDAHDTTLFRSLAKDEVGIMGQIDNGENVGTYQEPGESPLTLGSGNYDLVIITKDLLKNSFGPLKNAHDNTGVSTVIKTVEEIYSEYDGVDDAEKIRNFVIDAYNNWNIEYVLLGGDDDIIPERALWTPVDYEGGMCKHLPSDLYYAGLDGTWNNPVTLTPGDIEDLSLDDDFIVSVSHSGFIGSSEVDYSDYIIGDNSMKFTVDKSNRLRGCCELKFHPPLDMSGAQWVNFMAKCDYVPDSNTNYRATAEIYDTNGKKAFTSSSFALGDHWKSVVEYQDQLFIYNPNSINMESIDSISLVFEPAYPLQTSTEGDTIFIDGLHFTDFNKKAWGEKGEDDPCAEVYVGRACVGNTAETGNFVSKTISYMTTDSSQTNYLKKALMVGEDLGSKIVGKARWSGNYMDELIETCNKHNYITTGFSTSECNISKLYDKNKLNLNWPKSELISNINDNIHVINHLGHSNHNYNMKLECSDVYTLMNDEDKPFFVYSQGCIAGAFDYTSDCIAEYFTVKTSRGAFAGIWNSRMGVGNIFSTDGPSQRYHREFWDAVFAEDITEFGKANQDSKEDNLYRIHEVAMRWCYYELNLLGDPAVQFKAPTNSPPNKPSKPVGETSGTPGTEYTYATTTTDPDEDQLYYLWDWDDGTNSDWVGPYNSGDICEATHTWSEEGDYQIRVKAKDEYGLESEWSNALSATMPVIYEPEGLIAKLTVTPTTITRQNYRITFDASDSRPKLGLDDISDILFKIPMWIRWDFDGGGWDTRGWKLFSLHKIKLNKDMSYLFEDDNDGDANDNNNGNIIGSDSSGNTNVGVMYGGIGDFNAVNTYGANEGTSTSTSTGNSGPGGSTGPYSGQMAKRYYSARVEIKNFLGETSTASVQMCIDYTSNDDNIPVGPTPIDPTPVDPTPIEPAPIEPTPIDPMPIESTPTPVTPIDPANPIEPVKPIKPAISNPSLPSSTTTNFADTIRLNSLSF